MELYHQSKSQKPVAFILGRTLSSDPALDKFVSNALSAEEAGWIVFKEDLVKLGSACAILARKSPKAKKTDADRDRAWLLLAQIYMRETGRGRASVTVNPANSAAEGPFVRFVQAFMAAIPGEAMPTGNQIKGVVRKDKGKHRRLIHPLTYL